MANENKIEILYFKHLNFNWYITEFVFLYRGIEWRINIENINHTNKKNTQYDGVIRWCSGEKDGNRYSFASQKESWKKEFLKQLNNIPELIEAGVTSVREEIKDEFMLEKISHDELLEIINMNPELKWKLISALKESN